MTAASVAMTDRPLRLNAWLVAWLIALGSTALLYAAHAGHADIVRVLLANGARTDLSDDERRTPLMAGTQRGDYFVPDRHTLYAAQVLTQQLYSKVITTLRDLAGGGMIMLPSSVADFGNPDLRTLIGKTQNSPAADSVEVPPSS